MPRLDDGGNAGIGADTEIPDNAPPWFVSMHADIGVHEISGKRHNPTVVAYFRDAGFPEIKDDETAWCAAAVNAHLERSGYAGSKSLAARSFEKWGKEVEPRVGCVVPLWRDNPKSWQGHVGLYVGETTQHVLLLGGNQSNAVSIAKYPKSRVLGYRWPRTPAALRTNRAAAGSAASGATSGGLNVAADTLAGSPAPIKSAETPDIQPLQDGLAQLAPYFKVAAILAGVISVGLALYVIYRRTCDYKERGQ